MQYNVDNLIENLIFYSDIEDIGKHDKGCSDCVDSSVLRCDSLKTIDAVNKMAPQIWSDDNKRTPLKVKRYLMWI